MMGHREKLKGGDEWDAFSRKARRIVICLGRPGVVRWAKQKFNRRVRRAARLEVKAQALV